MEGLVNPSFLITDIAREILYCAHGDCEFATAYAIDAERGTLRPLGRAATGGVNGVHPALDPSGRFLIVANYASGSLGVLPVRSDGSLTDATQVLELPGPIGPHRVEQRSSHPHNVVFSPSGRFLLVPDKGLDRVFVLTFDPGRGQLTIAGEAVMRPGAGPRHIAFHPTLPFVFLVNELASTIATCRWDEPTGTLAPAHVVSTLPGDFFGISSAAAIVATPTATTSMSPIAAMTASPGFRFGTATGRLEPAGWTAANGADPRFMRLAPGGESLLVAAEQGDTIAAFEIAAKDGSLHPQCGVLSCASPCTIAFL